MALVMGVDSSTQSCKVVVMDAGTGAIVREGRASHPAGTEVDPQAWWQALQDAIADAGGMADVEAWAIGGQQHGMVAMDAAGEVIRPALLWNDTRSGGAAADLIAEFGAAQLAERTGLVPVASFTITKLRWLRDAEPDNAARVAAVALPHDWLTWRLRGFGPDNVDFDELITDRSDASGTGYWGAGPSGAGAAGAAASGDGTGTGGVAAAAGGAASGTDADADAAGYDRALLIAALGHDAALPRVLGPAEYVTDAAGRRVGPGAGDNAAAALGLRAGAGDAVVSIGTSGTVFAVSAERVTDTSGTVAGFAAADGNWLPLVATINAARVLETFGRVLDVDHAAFSALALAAPAGAGGLRLEPYLEGERTPNLPDATGTLTGMTPASMTRQNLARVAVEGMLGGLQFGLHTLQSLGVPVQRVLLIGGGAQSEAVRQIAPDVFGLPVEVPEPAEYVALGVARQAAAVLAA
ncbi:xylulokinase [Microbacterium kribbense]|uniref:Xylulokinase n=1 Tax=Microbacterium kribbense TaxID=433645 RepID=A0ABP7G3C0_9MICO